MPPRINVYSLPKFVEPEELAHGTVVILDVLRASTTIIYALQAGAKAVIPCREIDQARSIAGQYARGEVVLGGERNGLPIDQFDLGNSPDEYTPAMVKDKTIIFTSTNGTHALLHARYAKAILIGAFVNAAAIIQKLLGQKHIHLLCAGTDGQLSEDDILLAGMLVENIQREGGIAYKFNAQAIASQDLWLHTFKITARIVGKTTGTRAPSRRTAKKPGRQKPCGLGTRERYPGGGAISTASRMSPNSIPKPPASNL